MNLSRFHFAVLIFSALGQRSLAQSRYEVASPPFVECSSVELSWSEGTAPFELDIVGYNTTNDMVLHVYSFHKLSGSPFVWDNVTFPAGTSIRVHVTDRDGRPGETNASLVLVQPGSCGTAGATLPAISSSLPAPASSFGLLRSSPGPSSAEASSADFSVKFTTVLSTLFMTSSSNGITTLVPSKTVAHILPISTSSFLSSQLSAASSALVSSAIGAQNVANVSSSRSSSTGAIAGGVVGGLAVLALVAGLLLLRTRRKRRRSTEELGGTEAAAGSSGDGQEGEKDGIQVREDEGEAVSGHTMMMKKD